MVLQDMKQYFAQNRSQKQYFAQKIRHTESPPQSLTLVRKARVTRDYSPCFSSGRVHSALAVTPRFLIDPLGDKFKAKALKLLSQSIYEDNLECWISIFSSVVNSLC